MGDDEQGEFDFEDAPPTRHDQLREACVVFHVEHPEVWSLFCRFTFDRIKAGFGHYSAKAIFERIRWETDQADTEAPLWKVNNNFHAFYARAFMRHYPEHVGFFRTRRQTSNGEPPARPPELTADDFPTWPRDGLGVAP